jgi:hypothetical protein
LIHWQNVGRYALLLGEKRAPVSGGIYNLDTLKVISSTLSHNHASVGGGGIDNAGPLLFPWITRINHDKPVRCRDRLGGHPCRHARFPPGWVAHYR